MFCLRAFSASDGKFLLLPVETGESEIYLFTEVQTSNANKTQTDTGGGCLVAITDDMIKF